MSKQEIRCFRHRFEKPTERCALCEAKREGRGDFERARKIYLPKKRKSDQKDLR